MINNKPNISIIIPNYNHAPFLKERINSVLNQSYEKFEVIILDDCSIDNSKEIIEAYRRHPKVSHIVYNETNSGSTFYQWKKGIELAKGEYIWIAESDDVAEADFLERLMKISVISDNNISLAFSNIDLIDKNSRSMGDYTIQTFQPMPIVSGEYFIKHNMLYGCHILNASSVIFKRDAALKVSDEFLSFKGAGDYMFWIEIARQGNVYKDTKVLDHFRQHDIKVTPGTVASGSQFKEVYKIYNHLLGLGFIKGLMRQRVVGFWLHRIEQERSKFDTLEIYKECMTLWGQEVKFPFFSRILYLIDGIIRRHKKFFFGYAR